jgi:hypothetical protein
MEALMYSMMLAILNNKDGDITPTEEEIIAMNSFPNISTYHFLMDNFYHNPNSTIASRAFRFILAMLYVDEFYFLNLCLEREELHWRYAACQILEFMEGINIAKMLERIALSDISPDVRCEAVRILGRAGNIDSLAILQKIEKSDEGYDFEGRLIKNIALGSMEEILIRQKNGLIDF